MKRSYTVGFLASIALTIMPFVMVYYGTLHGGLLVAALMVFAVLQLLTQLIFFLHLGDEAKPRLQGLTFLYMAFIVGILVIGSLWIMENLNYHMHDSPQKIEQQLRNSDDL